MSKLSSADKAIATVGKSIGEAGGTFVFLGLAFIFGGFANGALLPTMLAYGAALTCAVAIFGNITGALFNPALSVSKLTFPGQPNRDLLPYIVAQVGAAVLASYAARTVLDAVAPGRFRYTAEVMIKPHVPFWAAFGVEALTTGLLTLIVVIGFRSAQSLAQAPEATSLNELQDVLLESQAKTTMEAGKPLWVGITLALAVGLGAHFTGGSVNPARALGPYLADGQFMRLGVTQNLRFLVIYSLAPLFGSVVAWWGYLMVDYAANKA